MLNKLARAPALGMKVVFLTNCTIQSTVNIMDVKFLIHVTVCFSEKYYIINNVWQYRNSTVQYA